MPRRTTADALDVSGILVLSLERIGMPLLEIRDGHPRRDAAPHLGHPRGNEQSHHAAPGNPDGIDTFLIDRSPAPDGIDCRPHIGQCQFRATGLGSVAGSAGIGMEECPALGDAPLGVGRFILLVVARPGVKRHQQRHRFVARRCVEKTLLLGAVGGARTGERLDLRRPAAGGGLQQDDERKAR